MIPFSPPRIDQKVIDESTRRLSNSFEKIRHDAIESFDKDVGRGKGVNREEGRASGEGVVEGDVAAGV